MRIVVVGLGAIGGGVAAGLHRAGREVLGVARGAMLTAVRESGLRLRAPELDVTVAVPVVGTPAEVDWRADDAVLLCVKSQHSLAALEDLRAAGVDRQPIFCAQNGVANERTALRLFPNVHGVAVMMPASYVTPGEVFVHAAPKLGLFDLGLATGGTDAADDAMAEALVAGGLVAHPDPDVMAAKHGKLLLNLANAVGAAFGPGPETQPLKDRLRAEALAVYDAAGIVWRDVSEADPRRRLIAWAEVPGASRPGTSSMQSLLRGTGDIETDWLNGEIALLGRLHGVPTPANALMQRVGARLAAGQAAPGSLDVAEALATLDG